MAFFMNRTVMSFSLICRKSIAAVVARKNIRRKPSIEKFSRFKRPVWPKLGLIPTSLALSFGFSKAKEANQVETARNPDEVLVEKADALYLEEKTHELYAFLKPHADSDSADVLWRLARAAVDKGKLIGKDPERKELYFEALGYATRAVEIDPNNFATHKWYGILLSYTGDYEGTKKKIGDAFVIRDHFKKALELKPTDATCYHLMGKWCMAFADMPWWQHKIAAALFATPPSSTYEEALDYFLKAEEVDPGFYSANLMMIGKVYERMGKATEARTYLEAARDAPGKKPDDKETHKEAVELLKKIGTK